MKTDAAMLAPYPKYHAGPSGLVVMFMVMVPKRDGDAVWEAARAMIKNMEPSTTGCFHSMALCQARVAFMVVVAHLFHPTRCVGKDACNQRCMEEPRAVSLSVRESFRQVSEHA